VQVDAIIGVEGKWTTVMGDSIRSMIGKLKKKTPVERPATQKETG
jgi:hypothetical protein